MFKKNRDNANGNKTAYIFTKETFGMTLLLFSAIVFVMLLTNDAVFAGIGKAICTFMFGTFGYGSFLIIAVTAYLGEWLVFEKSLKISVKASLIFALTVFVVFLLFHAATTRDYQLESYGGYISDCYKNAQSGFSGYTFGGVISAVCVYPIAKLTTFVGAYIIFSLFTVACGYLIYAMLIKKRKPVTESTEYICTPQEEQPVNNVASPVQARIVAEEAPVQRRVEPVAANARTSASDKRRRDEDADPYSQKNLGRKILFEKGEFDAESYRRNMIFSESSYFHHPVRNDNDYLNSFTSGNSAKASVPQPQQSYAESYQQDVLNQSVSSAPSNYVFGDKPVDKLEEFDKAAADIYSVRQPEKKEEEKVDFTRAIAEEAKNFEEPKPAAVQDYGFEKIQPEPEKRRNIDLRAVEEEKTESRNTRNAGFSEPAEEDEKPSDSDTVDMFKLFSSTNSSRTSNRIEPDISRLTSRRTRSNADLFDDDVEKSQSKEADVFTPIIRDAAADRLVGEKADKAEKKEIISERKPVAPAPKPEPKPEPPKEEEKPKHVWKKYVRPGLDLLDDYPEHSNVNTGEIEDNKRTIVETLANFKIDSEVTNVVIGPAVTRYDVVIEDKTKITQSLKYKEAIAMALMKDNVAAYLNFVKGALSIEVPNNVRTVVGLKSMLTSSKFINCKPNSITFGLGKNVEGEVVCPDITKMPHLLVAGTTGSGKSICLSALLISLLYKYGPDELRLILVDPKQVEFISYDKLPHLMINEIIYEVDKAIKALNWAIKEMERRYTLFKEMSENGRATKNLDEYNQHLAEGEEKLPKIVIILDEFGDLMLQAKKDIEGRIIKLVQKARACGIHLILATQRPSVDCITGLIKSNLPTRIGFKVNSFDDARTIFDIGGAEKLLGKGDMYFRSAENPDLTRIQGCFVDSHEVQNVCDFVKAHNETYFDQSVSDFINTVEEPETPSPSGGEDGADMGDAKIDETYIKALYYCVTSNQASVSMIQRRFPVGYIKACKIIDWMENMNYVTQSGGSKPRKVLLSKDEFINTYGEVDD